MKIKLLVIALSIVMILWFCGCGSYKQTVTESEAPKLDKETVVPAVPTETIKPETPAPSPTPSPTPEPEPILTVTKINFIEMWSVGEVETIDGSGREVILPADWSKWFDNATIDGMTLKDGEMHVNEVDDIYYLEKGYIIVTVTIDGTTYTFNIQIGSSFKYRIVEDGSIKLIVDSSFTPVE